MFPRVSKVRVGDKTYEYLRIVESYRDREGKKHQKVIGNLGRLDQIGDRLDVLVERLRTFCQQHFVLPQEISNEASLCWGPVLVVRRLWEELELDRIIETLCQGRREFPVAEHAFVLVANRLCGGKKQKSEHGLSRWLESMYVCDSRGKRYLPQCGCRPRRSARNSGSKSNGNSSMNGIERSMRCGIAKSRSRKSCF